jgi:hypothetical protein
MPSLGVSSLDLGRHVRPFFFQHGCWPQAMYPMRRLPTDARMSPPPVAHMTRRAWLRVARDSSTLSISWACCGRIGVVTVVLFCRKEARSSAVSSPDRLSRLVSRGLRFVRCTHRLLQRGRTDFPGHAAALLGRFLPRLGPLAKRAASFLWEVLAQLASRRVRGAATPPPRAVTAG